MDAARAATPPYALDAPAVVEAMGSDASAGLTAGDAAERLARRVAA